MRITVLGGCGAWPAAGDACSGYLVEHDGFRLLVDAGYATVPRLLRWITANEVDAVFITHGHPDHCADLNPLLRARVYTDSPAPEPLPVYAPPGALDAVLALEPSPWLNTARTVHELTEGALEIGPFRAETRLLQHFVPNLGIRLTAGDRTIAYTGDTGPTPEIAKLGRGADLLIAEATFVDEVPGESASYLSSARQAGQHATDAEAATLLLTHLQPGTDPVAARDAARDHYAREIDVATADLVIDLP
jgi:ribonuclease BN (tRNA processing enzyme)